MSKIFLYLFIFLFLVAQLFFGAAEAANKFSRPDLAVLYDELILALSKGENVIYVAAPPSKIERAPEFDKGLWWKECNGTTQLSDQGREDATTLGRAIHKIGFRYYTVKISEECLTLEVASLMFRSPDTPFVRTTDLNPAEYQRKQFSYIDDVIKLQIRGAIVSGFTVDENSFMISHRQPQEVALHPVMADLNPGDTAIFSLSTSGDLTLRARLNIHQWSEMADYAKHKRKLAR
jgi:hypothetical protein